MDYRGYLLEQKEMIVGCQVVVHKDGDFVRNGEVRGDMKTAMAEAHAYVDGLITKAQTA